MSATLGEIINHLKTLPPEMVVANGFKRPHSYRGDYSELAFEPAENVTVAEMLRLAESAVGRTFEGYKGGDFKMHLGTPCWLSEYGMWSEVPILLPDDAPTAVYVLPTAESAGADPVPVCQWRKSKNGLYADCGCTESEFFEVISVAEWKGCPYCLKPVALVPAEGDR